MKRLEIHLIWILSAQCGYSIQTFLWSHEVKSPKNEIWDKTWHTHIMILGVT